MPSERHAGATLVEQVFDATIDRPGGDRPGPVYIGGVRFDGQVWFDFGDRRVWDFYAFVRELAKSGVPVALEWKPFVPPGQVGLAAAFLGLDRPDDRGRLLHAALGLVHLDGADPTAEETIARARSVARVESHEPVEAADVAAVRSEGEALGVVTVPSLYRHGPVVAVHLNPAATLGDVGERARTILAVASDDGLWGLTKP